MGLSIWRLHERVGREVPHWLNQRPQFVRGRSHTVPLLFFLHLHFGEELRNVSKMSMSTPSGLDIKESCFNGMLLVFFPAKFPSWLKMDAFALCCSQINLAQTFLKVQKTSCFVPIEWKLLIVFSFALSKVRANVLVSLYVRCQDCSGQLNDIRGAVFFADTRPSWRMIRRFWAAQKR